MIDLGKYKEVTAVLKCKTLNPIFKINWAARI